MKFGYFTLSDNHYLNSTRTANDLVMDIVDEALYAEKLNYHSAWIGEHHFNSLGVMSCPDIALAYRFDMVLRGREDTPMDTTRS